MEAHQIALNKAKIQLMLHPDSTFFTTVLFSLVHIWDNSLATAATNGKYIKFNTDFFMSLDAEERLFLLLHETLHVVLSHMSRLGDRDPRKWNIAADYVINALLISLGYKMPKIGLYDEQYKGLSTEEVYKLLPEEDPNDPGSSACPWPDLESPPEDFEEAIKDILIRAAIQSKMAEDRPGTIPGEVQIFLDNLLTPKLPWHRILKRDLKTFAKNDYSYAKPNRRYSPAHYLPSLHSEALLDIAVATDTSGSVSDHDYSTIITETASIFKTMKPKKISLLQFDTKIKSVSVLKSVNDLRNVRFEGRGGTQIEPVLNWAVINKPQLLLIFTDGEFNFNCDDPIIKSKVIWLIHNNKNFKAPFGKVIHYAIKG